MIVSIIVPIYNVEKYLERCIDSLVDQDIDVNDYEIIMVNDGSTDNSKTIAEQLVEKYQNVTLYNQENRGLAGARNTGMKHAVGKYLMFVDSDDYLETNSISPILECSEKYDLDVCSFLLKVYRKDGTIYYGSKHPFPVNEVFDGLSLVRKGINSSSACCGLYLHSFLEANNLFFHEGITHEDVEFNNRLYLHAKRIMFTDFAPYNYCWNGESLNRSNDIDKVRKAFLDDIDVAGFGLRYVTEKAFPKDIVQLYSRRANSLIVSKMLYLFMNRKSRFALGHDFLERSKAFDLYPIKGRTLSWKTNIMIPIFNCKKIANILRNK